MSNQETARQIFDAGVAASKERDVIIIEMVQAGLSLNMAQNSYKDMAKSAGLTKPRTGHKKEALEHIGQSNVDLLDDEKRIALKEELANMYNVSLGTAHDYIRAYADIHKIELNLTGPIGRNSDDIYEFIRDNPFCDKEQFREFMYELGRSSGNIDETWRGVKLARRLMEEHEWGVKESVFDQVEKVA